PPSAAASVEAACPEVFPATSFDTPGVDLGAGSRTGVALVVTAIVIILQKSGSTGCIFRSDLAPFFQNPQSKENQCLRRKVHVMLSEQFRATLRSWTFEIMLTAKPMIAVTKRNEYIAWTRVTRRILIEVTVASDVS